MQTPIGLALIVDDDPLQIEVIRDHLEESVVTTVVTAINGCDAKRKLEALGAHPDLIVCDLQMPDCDGIEFLDSLREMSSSSQIVFVSGAPATQVTAAANLAGAYGLNVLGWLRKPMNRDAFDALLGRMKPDGHHSLQASA